MAADSSDSYSQRKRSTLTPLLAPLQRTHSSGTTIPSTILTKYEQQHCRPPRSIHIAIEARQQLNALSYYCFYAAALCAHPSGTLSFPPLKRPTVDTMTRAKLSGASRARCAASTMPRVMESTSVIHNDCELNESKHILATSSLRDSFRCCYHCVRACSNQMRRLNYFRSSRLYVHERTIAVHSMKAPCIIAVAVISLGKLSVQGWNLLCEDSHDSYENAQITNKQANIERRAVFSRQLLQAPVLDPTDAPAVVFVSHCRRQPAQVA